MDILAVDVMKVYSIALRSNDGYARRNVPMWSPDCFGDLECNFPINHPDRICGYIVATKAEVEELVDWWESEVENANWDSDYEGEGLCADGMYWSLDVEENKFWGECFLTAEELALIDEYLGKAQA